MKIRTNSVSNDSIVYIQMYDIDSIIGKNFKHQTKLKYQEKEKFNILSSPMIEVSKSDKIIDEINRSLLFYPVRDKEDIRREKPRRTYWFRKIYGYRGFIETAYTQGVGNKKINRVEFATSQGFQFNPTYYLGVGAVYSVALKNELLPLPLFLNGRINFQDARTTPFLDMRIGYSILEKKGVYYSCTFGVSISENDKFSFNIGLGYSTQESRYTNNNMTKIEEKYNGFSLKIAFEY